jgi:DnaK suppressor protein
MRTIDHKALEVGLKSRARELARTLAERNRIAIERAADVFDAALLASGRESSARTLEQDSRLLRQVETALERLRDRTFGTCEGCQDKIAPKRLRAIPWATRCVSCQERIETSDMSPPRLALAA